jgi:DMSO reductase anchor subunit
MIFWLLILITGFCLVMALRRNKTYFLFVPFLSIFVYFLVEILMVPAPFFDTVKFIFSLS